MDGVALHLVARHRARFRHHYGLLTIPAIVIALAALVGPSAVPTFANHGKDNRLPLDQPLQYAFGWPVSRTIDFTISPHVDGEVVYSNPMVGDRLVRTVAFVPDHSWQPDTTYSVTLGNVKSATSTLQNASTFHFTFTTASAPHFVRTDPALTTTLNTDASWVVTFDQPIGPTTDVSFTLDPPLPIQVTPSSDRTAFTVRPTQLLPQGHNVKLTVAVALQDLTLTTGQVFTAHDPTTVFTGSWSVREPPGLASVTPAGTGVALVTPVTLAFAEAVDLSQVQTSVQLTPATTGTWKRVDDQHFEFTHDAFAQATTYTLTITHGLQTKSGGHFETDEQLQFRTVEPIALSSSVPANSGSGIGVGQVLHFTFNQSLGANAVAQYASIAPSLPGAWAQSGNTATFTPTASMPHSTSYTVTFRSGIPSATGLPATTDQVVHFTTEAAVSRLAVPFHRQEHRLSCEAAALYMALQYRGVSVTENQIISRVGFDPTPKKNGVWGDPNVAFVGDINGSQPGTGYGVYAAPIAKVAAAYRPGSHVRLHPHTALHAHFAHAPPHRSDRRAHV